MHPAMIPAGPDGFTVDDDRMWPWLTRAADIHDGPDAPDPAAARGLPQTGYGWRPRQPGAPAAVAALISRAAAAGILAGPPGVTPALLYCPADGGTYRVLVTVTWPGGDGPLTLATPPGPWREIGQPGTAGPAAAACILAEAARAASGLLARLAAYAGPAAAAPAP